MRYHRETCFKLNGYLECWDELKDQKRREAVSSGSGYVFRTFDKSDSMGWIIDSRAIAHMTSHPNDFLSTTKPR